MHLSQRDLFLNHQAQTTHFPLLLEAASADGCYITDVNGKKYLDFISGIGVSSLGHGNKPVIDAITTQANQYLHLMVYGEFVQSPQVRLASHLTGLLPQSLNSVYFVNSGAEATEGALKLAKRVTGRPRILGCYEAYHGSTHAGLSLNSSEYFRIVYAPLLPGTGFIRFGEPDDIALIDETVAAVVVETVRGESGYHTAPEGYLKALEIHCKQMGTLLILDEIQCGMGRTGTLFAFEQEGIIPDILLLGKALGGGMPMGAFVSSREHMMQFADQPILGHITTFGGHPVCCAAADAALTQLADPKLLKDVKRKEQLFRDLLKHPKIKGITGRGLMLAIEFGSFDENKQLIDACLLDGLITDWFLFATHKMRLAPPLIINDAQISEACQIILHNCQKFPTN